MIIIQGKNVIKFIREVYTKWHGVLEDMGVCIHFLGNQARLYEEHEMWTKMAGFLSTDRKKHTPVEEIEVRMAWTLWTILSLGNNEEFSFPMLVNTSAAAAESLQSCPTLCDPTDISPPGSPVPGILQARTLEWVAISFSNAGKWKVKVKSLSRVWLFATPWTAAYQAPPSMGFSRQEYWSGVPLPSP